MKRISENGSKMMIVLGLVMLAVGWFVNIGLFGAGAAIFVINLSNLEYHRKHKKRKK